MKRITGFFTAAILICVYILGLMPQITAEAITPKSHISSLNGSFIQPWLYANWDDSRWQSEMKVLKETGIDTLIMGDVANQNRDDTWTVYYPSELDFLKGYYAYDAVSTILHYCQMYDIKLYLGMGLDTNWNSDLTTQEGLIANSEYMKKCNMITEELYKNYKWQYPDTYYGFYFVTELYNTVYMDTDYGTMLYTDGLQDMFTKVIDNCGHLDPSMPILFSPYVNIFGYGYASINADRFEEFWTQALTKIPFRDGDMLCPQDSCGGGGNDIEHLEQWTKAYRNAVDRSNKTRGTHLLLGTNAEMFIQPDAVRMAQPHGIDYTGTKTVDDFAKRLEITAPYVDALFCFAYTHHYSPYNAVPGFHKAFVSYLSDGEIEQNPPSPPDTLRTDVINAEGGSHLKLTFSGMTDDTDVGLINIYKNGRLYDYLVPGVNNGRTGFNHVQNTWTDYEFDISHDSAVYELEAVDVCGNVSQKRSYEVTPENVNNGVNIQSDNANMGAAVIWNKTSLEYLSYTVTDGGIRITDCDPDAVNIDIPYTIEGKPVTVIDWYAFENCKKLTSVHIPDTVTHISRFAFVHCISLEKINMPSSLYSIEQYAFFDCPELDDIVLPDGLAVIEQRAFSGCLKLSGISVPASCKTIGEYAFFDCVSMHSICVKGSDTAFGERSIGYVYDSGYNLQDCFVLDAPDDSVAAGYAEENGICLKSEILMGDTDDNGVVDIKDIVMMCRWMLGAGEMNNPCAADINNNGVPDISDFCMLKHMIVSSF
ncbi:MAG: DUF4434 domain-containing protein [Oscillospiraceae bacterium]|nr:DUF4434 domain-containing protein [Oscillospiraceae bacterium]